MANEGVPVDDAGLEDDGDKAVVVSGTIFF